MLHMSDLFQKIIYFILVTNIENHQTKWKAMLTKNSRIDNTVLKKSFKNESKESYQIRKGTSRFNLKINLDLKKRTEYKKLKKRLNVFTVSKQKGHTSVVESYFCDREQNLNIFCFNLDKYRQCKQVINSVTVNN